MATEPLRKTRNCWPRDPTWWLKKIPFSQDWREGAGGKTNLGYVHFLRLYQVPIDVSDLLFSTSAELFDPSR